MESTKQYDNTHNIFRKHLLNITHKREAIKLKKISLVSNRPFCTLYANMIRISNVLRREDQLHEYFVILLFPQLLYSNHKTF